MFPNDLWIVDPYKGKLMTVVNDVPSEVIQIESSSDVTHLSTTVKTTTVNTTTTKYDGTVESNEESTVETTRTGNLANTALEPSSVMVSQDRVSVFVASRSKNCVYHYKKSSETGKMELFQKITVGMQPFAMCEDPHGNVYVANYGDNTVSKIEVPSFKKSSAVAGEEGQDKVVKTISVSAGPRDLVSDEDGAIWVACYLSHKIDSKTGADLGGIVSKIVNDSVVDSITVGLNPAAITCDESDTIWVANSGSNTVSRIVKSKKIADYQVGARPMALVCDSYGNVFTANYDADTVTIIETSTKALATGNNVTTVPVGDGPNAIGVNMEDDIYVVCGLENTVRKIVDKQVVSVIAVCDSPVAFGDFTGCAAYNTQNVMAKPEKGTTDEKVQAALDKVRNAEAAVADMQAKVTQAVADVAEAKNAATVATDKAKEAVDKVAEVKESLANTDGRVTAVEGTLETTKAKAEENATAIEGIKEAAQTAKQAADAEAEKVTALEKQVKELSKPKLDVKVTASEPIEGSTDTKVTFTIGNKAVAPTQAPTVKLQDVETPVTTTKVSDGVFSAIIPNAKLGSTVKFVVPVDAEEENNLSQDVYVESLAGLADKFTVFNCGFVAIDKANAVQWDADQNAPAADFFNTVTGGVEWKFNSDSKSVESKFVPMAAGKKFFFIAAEANYVAAHADLTQRLFLNKFKPVFTEATTPTAGTLSGKKVFVFELSEATGVLVEYANLDF
jgi:NHL repeat-containing protein